MSLIKSQPVFYKSNLLDQVEKVLVNENKELDIIIANVCNINPKILNGFTKTLISRFPNIADNLSIQKHDLGQNNYIQVSKNNNSRLFFCQMFTDRKNQKTKKNINYVYLSQCLLQVRQQCHHAKKDLDKEVQIHCPKFGTGHSGGRWSTILDMVTDYWDGIPTFFYTH